MGALWQPVVKRTNLATHIYHSPMGTSTALKIFKAGYNSSMPRHLILAAPPQ